jgi:tetraacyldisaccharide 4'-kinase
MIDKIWYKRKPSLLSFILCPISFIFSKISSYRKSKLQQAQYKSKIPVIIVGNISVGGTGKTPVVRKLAEQYLAAGKKLVIISRGYGAKAENYPFEVDKNTPASVCGDEPAMLYDALEAKVPIVISPQRVDSVKYIETKYPDTDVIISDDGLQHYKLARDKEIVIVDASRMFGNNMCLPAGPLREPITRLKSVDQVIVIGNCSDQDKKMLEGYNKNIDFMQVVAKGFVNNVVSKKKLDISSFAEKEVIAVAGIGNPNKFFTTLQENDINIKATKIFKDHHNYKAKDFVNFKDDQIVIMTYKDAIKCQGFAKSNWWYLDIEISNDICFS